MKKIKLILGYLSITLLSFFSIQANANLTDSENLIGAATGCFPRVFSQIDQFKSSSGGLRNLNANPRTVVCSIDINHHEEIGTASIRVFAHIIDNDNAPGTSCTLYVRDSNTGGLVNSQTEVFPPGANGKQSSFLQVARADSHTNYTFIQCTLPGNARIMQLETYYF